MLQTLINIIRPLLLSVFQQPTALSVEQLNSTIQRLLKYVIALLISAVLLVIITTFLIDRTLDQLDQKIFALSPSMILLLILLAINVAVLIALFMQGGKEKTSTAPMPAAQSPLEHAVSILILDLVKEREVQRQQRSPVANQESH